MVLVLREGITAEQDWRFLVFGLSGFLLDHWDLREIYSKRSKRDLLRLVVFEELLAFHAFIFLAVHIVPANEDVHLGILLGFYGPSIDVGFTLIGPSSLRAGLIDSSLAPSQTLIEVVKIPDKPLNLLSQGVGVMLIEEADDVVLES